MNAAANDETRPPGEIVSLNPATLEELGRVPVCSKAEVQAAVLRARAAQKVGSQRS